VAVLTSGASQPRFPFERVSPTPQQGS
jgi:hypothetical protein